jgi:uncharacterized protein
MSTHNRRYPGWREYEYGPKYGIRIDATVRVPMRDGIELGAKITRPDADGRFPALVEYNPYRRIKRPLDDPHEEYPPLVPYMAERGYVIVQYDVRGTGNSAGVSRDIYSDQERQDGYEMIEWAASQPWCTGAVGMFGKSYSAVVQWQVAVQAPPSLKAIVVRSANDDVYTEWTNPGGALRPYMFESYAPLMTAMNFAPPDPDLLGTKWADVWRERLENNLPWGIAWIEHLRDGEYWRAKSLRPRYDRVKCPVFVIDGWADWYSTALLRAFMNVRTPRKVMIGPWGHYYAEEQQALPGPRIDTRVEYLRWFDHWLTGAETGIMDEPPVAVFMRQYQEPAPVCVEDRGIWLFENEWPPARAVERPFYFGTSGRLSADSAATEPVECDQYTYHPECGIMTGRHGRGNISPWAMPLDQRLDDAYAVTYTTDFLTEDLDIIGVPFANLYVSSSADTAYFYIKLCDVAPDGVSKWVTDGGLNATHRNSHEQPEPLEPGAKYEIRFELKHVAYRFEAGHRIRVSIASADFQNAWPMAKRAVNSIYRGGDWASHVKLPIAGPRQTALPTPDFKPSPHKTLPLSGLPKPKYTVTHDLINQTTTAYFKTVPTSPPSGINESSYTVSNLNPAEAVIDSSCEYAVSRADSEIKIDAHCVTASNDAAYRHLVDVEISVNGKRYFNKSWSVAVPRLLD